MNVGSKAAALRALREQRGDTKPVANVAPAPKQSKAEPQTDAPATNEGESTSYEKRKAWQRDYMRRYRAKAKASPV